MEMRRSTLEGGDDAPESNTGAPVVALSPTADAVCLPPPPSPLQVVTLMMRSLKPTTLKAYRYSLVRYAAWCRQPVDLAASELLSLSAGTALMRLHQYRASFPLETRTATINARFAGIRALVGFAKSVGLVSWDVGVKTEKIERYRDTRGPGRDVVIRLVALLRDQDTARGRRDYAMARLLYDLGLRREGVVSLDLANYDPEGMTLEVLLKGRRERSRKGLPAVTATAIDRWLDLRGREPGPLFVRFSVQGAMAQERLAGDGLYRVVRSWGNALGLSKPLRPHGLRHTAITETIKHERNLGAVRVFSDHASIATLTHYLDADDAAQKRLSSRIAEDLGRLGGI